MARKHDPGAKAQVHVGGGAGWWSVVLASALLLFYGARAQAACDPNICGASPCTISGTHTIDSGCVLNFGAKDVILTGTLQGDNNAACYTVIADDFTVRGSLRARSSCVVVDITGVFSTVVVSNSAAIVDVREANGAGDGVDVEAASIVLDGKNVIANGANGFGGGDITMTATTGDITGDSPVEARGTGGGDGGTITFTSTAGNIDLEGNMDADGLGEFAFGGAITFDAAGTVTTDGSLGAQGSVGGDGGSIDYLAGGATTVSGNLNVNGNGDFAFGGFITVDTGSLSTGSTWNARGDQSGFGGDIEIGATGLVETTTGTGSFNVTGGSGGGDGGTIDLSTSGEVDLDGDMDAGGVGEFAFGGLIFIAGGNNHTVNVRSTSRIEADASGTDASNGFIDVSACHIDISGVIDTRNTQLDSGENDFTYNGSLISRSGAQVLADNDAGNFVFCRCVDVADPIGSCDSPAACASAPVFGGTWTPAAVVTPILLPPCS